MRTDKRSPLDFIHHTKIMEVFMKKQSLLMRIAVVAIGLILLLPLTVLGAWPDLTAQQLKDLMDSSQEVFLLNSLSDLEFNEAHIPGSVNIPLHTIMRSKELPENKDTVIVSYCLSKK